MSHPGELSPDQSSAVEALRRSQRVVLTGHVRPDGDCIGAQTALARTLQVLGKDVWIINPDPIQDQFDYLGKDCRFGTYQGGDLPVHDLTVLLDFCEIDRCGPMADAVRRSPSKKMIIDHHLFAGEPWWDESFVDSRASATGVLVWRVAKALGIEMDAAAARGVFTSIVTDTGWLKYSNTDAETLAVASELVGSGVQPAEIYSAIYQRNPADQPRAIGRVLERLEYFDSGRIAVVDLPHRTAGEPELSDSDEVLDLLRSVKRVETVLFIRELADGTCKLSARSKNERSVHDLAVRFGGGGHAKASGATLAGPLVEARQRLIDEALSLWAGEGAEVPENGQ